MQWSVKVIIFVPFIDGTWSFASCIQCCGDSKQIGSSGTYALFLMVKVWVLPMSSVILHFRVSNASILRPEEMPVHLSCPAGRRSTKWCLNGLMQQLACVSMPMRCESVSKVVIWALDGSCLWVAAHAVMTRLVFHFVFVQSCAKSTNVVLTLSLNLIHFLFDFLWRLKMRLQ